MIEFKVLNSTLVVKENELQLAEEKKRLLTEYLLCFELPRFEFESNIKRLLKSDLLQQESNQIDDIHSIQNLKYSLLVNQADLIKFDQDRKTVLNQKLKILKQAREIQNSIEINLKICGLLEFDDDQKYDILLGLLGRKHSTKEAGEILDDLVSLLRKNSFDQQAEKIKDFLKKGDEFEHHKVDIEEHVMDVDEEVEEQMVIFSGDGDRSKVEHYEFTFQMGLFESTKLLIISSKSHVKFDPDYIPLLSDQIKIDQEEIVNSESSTKLDVIEVDSDNDQEQSTSRSDAIEIDKDESEEESKQSSDVMEIDKEEFINNSQSKPENADGTIEVAQESEEESSEQDSDSQKGEEDNKRKNRQSMRVKQQQTVEEKEPETKTSSLLELNDILPDHYQFTRTGSNLECKFDHVMFSRIKNQFTKNENKAVEIEKGFKQIENIDCWIFGKGSDKFLEWNQNHINEIYHLPFLLFKILVFSILKNDENVCKEFIDFIVNLTQIVLDQTDYFKDLFSDSFFDKMHQNEVSDY
jgi:hypothetical protein